MIEIEPKLFFVFWENLYKEYALPHELYTIIAKCFKNEYINLKNIHSDIENVIQQLKQLSILEVHEIRYSEKCLKKNIENLYYGILSSKNKTKVADYPNVPFIKNENNISNGALGIVYALKSVNINELLKLPTLKMGFVP